MFAKVNSGTTVGLEGVSIDVEVDVASRGFPTFTIVGLANKAVDEAKERVRTAIVNVAYDMPDSRITVNLAPADLPKEGSHLDLPIAVGILTASGVIERSSLKGNIFIGELSLEGEVRKVPGTISIALMALKHKISNLYIPHENAEEVAVIEGIIIYPVFKLIDLILHLNGKKLLSPLQKTTYNINKKPSYEFDFCEIKGQETAKRALEIAAAGFHNIHLKGPPGAGKTMLSRAFPSILPPLSGNESLEVLKIYSVAGLLRGDSASVSRPFRSPHHTTSRIGLIGGGSNPAPGEISLAHYGVLFLDEFPEFPRGVIEALRQPLEDHSVTISRASGSLSFPCRFLLVAASNPCPCGYLGHPKKTCKCMPGSILRYRKRLSGPILDRIDLHIDVPPVEEEKLVDYGLAETSEKIAIRVISAHKIQKLRFKDVDISNNSQMKSSDIKKFCLLDDESLALLKQAITRLSLSARSYFKIIKLARTIADLDGQQKITQSHLAEALQYRLKDE